MAEQLTAAEEQRRIGELREMLRAWLGSEDAERRGALYRAMLDAIEESGLDRGQFWATVAIHAEIELASAHAAAHRSADYVREIRKQLDYHESELRRAAEETKTRNEGRVM